MVYIMFVVYFEIAKVYSGPKTVRGLKSLGNTAVLVV